MFPEYHRKRIKTGYIQDENYLNLTAWNGTMETSDKDLDKKPNGIS
jgi:hypothetical protein